MKKGNMLKDANDNVTFMRLSESEIADDMRSEMMAFDGIPEYSDGEVPSDEDIATVEKVLKYASQCNYMSFTGADARLVMGCSTNVLRWSLSNKDRDGDE